MHDLDYTFPAVLWGGNALTQRSLHLAAIALALMANSLPVLGQSFEQIYARESAENWRETMKAYASAAKSGNCQSAKRLGEIHARGLLGRPTDLGQSVGRTGQANTLGCPARQTLEFPVAFADIYAREMRGDARETVSAYVGAARGGNCQAAKRLGEIYEWSVLGIPQDTTESMKWYDTARALGCSSAGLDPKPAPGWGSLFSRGVISEKAGKGAEAVEAYAQIARYSCDATMRLHEIYAKGLHGVPSSHEEAMKWYNSGRAMGCSLPALKIT